MSERLQVANADDERSLHPLTGERLSLGRARDNDLSYPEDSGLSRHHMVVEKIGDRWWVRDLGSKNGTLVNEQRISERVSLNPGDRIRASKLVLTFETTDANIDSANTVIFDPAKEQTGHAPTHTVTLGQLVSHEGGTDEASTPSTQWTDPVTALIRAGRELVARKPMDELFSDILDLSLEAVGASRGVLMLLDDGVLHPQALRGRKFHISSVVRDRVMEERTSVLVGDVASDEILSARESIVMQQIQSLMAVPLQTDELVLGLIYVDTPHAWRHFTPSDLNLLTVMANVAAMRIEREKYAMAEKAREMMERELSQAAEIQRQFLPTAAPNVPGFDVAGYNAPCHGVGGDYYDYVTYPDGSLLVALGDVAGKGMPASLLMVHLAARVQMLAERPGTPAEIVESLNRTLHRVCPSNRFVTFFLAHMNSETGQISFCNAGHNPPYVVRAGGGLETLEGGGPVLGILPGISFQGRIADVQPGDSIVMFSDGVTEATNSELEEFGEERLEKILVRNRHLGAGDLIAKINSELNEFVGDAPPFDDLTIVVARRTAIQVRGKS